LAHKPGKTPVQVATFEVPVDYLLEIRPPEAVAHGKSFFVDPLKGIIVILDALVEGGQMRFTGAVDGRGFGHRFPHKK
jgi:hypothetical protein